MNQRHNEYERVLRREFGIYLRGLRKKERGRTLEKASDCLGISAGEVSYIEKGKRRVSDSLLLRFAKLYKVPLGEMLMKKYWPQLPLLPGIMEPTYLVADLHKYLYPEEVEDVSYYIADILLKRNHRE